MEQNQFIHLKNFLRNSIIPYVFPHINQEGWKFVIAFALVTALLAWLWAPLGTIGLILTVWCYFFFRDPQRITPQIDGIVVSPADGKVQMITKVRGPRELGMDKQEFTRISIFMSVFNVHVNRAPASGTIVASSYVKGKFFNATLDKASLDNERQLLAMKTESEQTIAFVQIAGLVARRILCFVKKGHILKAGERFGLIRFGSRLDVYLPLGIEPQVCVGQTMIAGETVLANLKSSAPKVNGEAH